MIQYILVFILGALVGYWKGEQKYWNLLKDELSYEREQLKKMIQEFDDVFKD